MSQAVLKVDGLVNRPLELSYDDLASLPEQWQIADISRFRPNRKGSGVALEAILERAGVSAEADYLTLHADRDDFHVSVPLAAVRSEAIIVHDLNGSPLTVEEGGPFRFLIRDPAACHTDELDDCANVKYVSRIELTNGRGRDTRPMTDEDHEKLHAQ